MSNLAIIPARGGSKRIPGKNVKDFLGKPIISYSIEAALTSKLFNEVMVSTDDENIANIARQYGATVPFMRSSKNSDDYATTLDVIREVLETYKIKEGKLFQNVCCIYPTAPLLQVKHLQQGLNKLTAFNLTSVFPVVAFSYPVWRGVYVDENQRMKMVWPEYLNSRSQDLPQVYHDAGQWYWFKANRVEQSLFTEDTGVIILSEEEVQDIDTKTDWRLAEMKYRLTHEA